MKVAFASCIHCGVYPNQPVWDWIRAHSPDYLVLLGDAIYLDVNNPLGMPQATTDDQFAQSLHLLYGRQLAQRQFKALLQSLPAGRVFSIWDDHDFLWDNAMGALIGKDPAYQGKIRLSTAFHEAFRAALAAGATDGAFPASYADPIFWNADASALATPSLQLVDGTWLHLSDGRTYRTSNSRLVPETKRHLFGAAQRARFAQRMAASAPGSVHLFASGSTSGDFKGGYPNDWHWLLDQAAQRRVLMLSGDIHRNASDAFYTQGLPLHEATSSGAAVKDAVVIGARRRNYGIVEVQDSTVAFRLYADDQLEPAKSRTLSRATWLPI